MGLNRWEQRAQRRAHDARREAPAWFDMERLPWWLFALTGILFLGMCLANLLDPQSSGERAWAVVGLATVVPAQFLTAHRLRRGIPLAQPWWRRRS